VTTQQLERLVHAADLDPSLVTRNTYLTRRRFTRIDAAALLSTMIGLLYLFPETMVVPSITDLGRPGLLLGLVMFVWWALARFSPRLAMLGPQPMRLAVAAYVTSLLASYAVGQLRGLTSIEANGADRAVLNALVFIGVILVAADGVPNWERLERILRVMVWCATFMAIVGHLQSLVGFDLTRYLMVPGMGSHGWLPGFEQRGSGLRVPSTTVHNIEYTSVMAIALPFAIHYARFARNKKVRRWYAVSALVILAAIPLGVSRTGILALIVVAAVMAIVWDHRHRYNMAVLLVVLTAGFMVVRPGLLGTISDMFFNADKDSSVTARTDRYAIVGHYFSQRPWLGRGTGTWLPPQYIILDNQWLNTVLSTGIIGVLALAAVNITAIVLAVTALRRSPASKADRHLCAALVTTQVIALVVAATFDSLYFTTLSTTVALTAGCCGAVWRFTHPKRLVRTSAVNRFLA
jgi:O-antigen ligase